MKFAVSTTAFRSKSIEEVIQIAGDLGHGLEFSSGLPFRENMEEIFFKAEVFRLPHNYFPAPKEPFVLNLASLDRCIWEKSMDHCMRGLNMAARVHAPFYSVHSGFCVDLEPHHLGRQFPLQPQRPREVYWKQFVKAVKLLVDEARRLEISFLVENNVVAPKNVLPDGVTPLLNSAYAEILRLMTEIGDKSLGLLLDTGHLKVSAKSLNFSEKLFLEKTGPFIRAIHHSDNGGEEDSNQALTSDYWFLPYMQTHKNSFHILEVHDQSVSQIKKQFELLQNAANAG